MERTASAMETQLAASWRSGDPATDQTMLKTAREMAHAHRELKQLVLLSGDEGLGKVRTAIEEQVVEAVMGRWAKLPRAELPAKTPATRLRAIVSGVRAITVAVLPLAVLLLAPRLSPGIDHTWLGRVVPFVYIWTGVSALLMLDPLIGNKLALVKEAMTMFPPRQGERA